METMYRTLSLIKDNTSPGVHEIPSKFVSETKEHIHTVDNSFLNEGLVPCNGCNFGKDTFKPR